jgi:hypothetical protein
VHFGTVDCTVHQRICNQHGINAYPTTIFFNQSRPHRYQVGVFSTSLASTLSSPLSSSTRAAHTATRWDFCNRHGINAYPTTIILQPEPATSLPGWIVCNQHGIHAYLSSTRAGHITTRWDCFCTSLVSMLILPPSFLNQSRPHRYQVGFLQPAWHQRLSYHPHSN